MMVSEVYWFDCSQRMPETDRMVLVWSAAIGGTRYGGYERDLDEWTLDLGEQVRSRDVTQWAELPVPPMGHGAPNGFDWMRRFTAYMMSQYEIEEETAQWAAIQCAADEFNLSEVEQRDADWTKSAEAAADEWLWGFGPE